MRWINNKWYITCQSKLSPRNIGVVSYGIYRQSTDIIEFKCVCGCILNIEESVVQLLHPCSKCDGDVDELGCTDCLTILKSMTG